MILLDKILKPFRRSSLTRRRAWFAVSIAVVADLLQIPATPIPLLPEIIDVTTMIVTAWLLGFHWLLLPTFVVEFFPIVDMLPTWTACVGGVIALRKGMQPRAGAPPKSIVVAGKPDEPPSLTS
jgi:hypothetical protein